jgi:predicted 2-oxoglutarate/Fe(II)-dependent dioxygenase YbiX
MTMAVMLSGPDEYEGGAIELEQPPEAAPHSGGSFRPPLPPAEEPRRVERHTPTRGEAVAWRGWTLHRIVPVTRGTREVFVVEWY